MPLTTGTDSGGYGPYNGNGGNGPSDLAYTGTNLAPGPLLGLSALLLVLGGALLAFTQLRSRRRRNQ